MTMKKRAQALYPIPKSRIKNVIWVNSTPHLSRVVADEHANILANGRVTYSEFCSRLHSLLSELLTTDLHRSYNDYWYQLAARGPEYIYHEISDIFLTSDGSITYMLDRLSKDKVDIVTEPTLAPTSGEDIQLLHDWVFSLPDSPLNNYEKKLFLKYSGDSSRRSGAGYIKQIRDNYLSSRPEWTSTVMPNMNMYEHALRIYKKINGIEASFDGSLDIINLKGYLSRARSTTFGGFPYLKNMADFVSADESDPTTYADLYNRLAIGWLYLKPGDKDTLYPSFIALERVQPGGIVDYQPDVSLDAQHYKDNKQRFVQAQSAVISHAYKFLVDGVNLQMRKYRPTMSSDKFGEELVTGEMKRLASIGFGKYPPHNEDILINYNVVGTDYSNFDASQDVCISNDAHYMNWRRIAPARMCYYIIDPYIRGTYALSNILVPKFGSVTTTGVKSGMCDTNQCDTQNCAVADALELIYFNEQCRVTGKYSSILSDEEIVTMMGYTMDNGDDRFKLTLCDAEQIEAADHQLGYIAQKSKQEVMPLGTKLKDFGVTYLKTILCAVNDKFVRTDAITKLILARIHPESVVATDHECSLVVDFLMSASRSFESPYLYVYVDYMYARLPLFRDLIDGRIDFKYLIDHMVVEQLEALRLTRGEKWIRRKGMDYAASVERVNTKYGYGEEGHRGTVGAINVDGSGLEALPQVQAIMSIAYERKVKGVLGSTFERRFNNG